MNIGNAIQQNNTKHHQTAVMFSIARLIFAFIFIISLILTAGLVFKKNSNANNANRFSNDNISYAGNNYPSRPGQDNSLQPVSIEIPAINLKANVAPVGLDPNQGLEIPSQENVVGWYKYGPPPGNIGSSVIVGHLDSTAGPAIFWRLNKLKSNDQIIIGFGNGTKKIFSVYDKNSYSQNNFPSSLVYANTNFAGLNLITCAGAFDHRTQSYSNNLVVFSRLLKNN